MTTMLDKAAAAAWPFLWDATDTATPAHDAARARMRAALQAIREVDQGTYNAGWDAMTGEPDAGPGEPWLAMIDTILAEDKG